MNKAQRIIAILLTVSGCLFTSCNKGNKNIQWSKWFDNGDGTHSRHDVDDITHQETEPHHYEIVRYITEPTEVAPGEAIFQCDLCGAKEQQKVKPTGDYTFDQEVVADKYLYKKCSEHSAIYYKSSVEGAYGNPDELFEHSDVDSGYTEVEYIKSDGRQFIDTGIENTTEYSVSINGEKQDPLPSGYSRLEYIESTGEQYIDTGIAANENLTKVTGSLTSINPEGTRGILFGFYGGGHDLLYVDYSDPGLNTHNVMVGYDDIPTTKIDSGVSNGPGKADFILTKDGFDYCYTVNGSTVCGTNRTQNETSYPYYLFARNNRGVADYFCRVRVHNWKLYINNILVRDFVPALQTSDLECGLFDLVTNQFFTNQGQGSFIAGDEIDNQTQRVPAEYQEVEYIDEVNPGKAETSQHNRLVIDSVKYNRIEAKLSVNGTGTNGGIILSSSTGLWYTTWQGTGSAYITMTPSNITEDSWTNIILESEDVYTGFMTGGWSDPINYWTPQSIKFEYIKTFVDSELTSNLIPCYRVSDNEPGMFDVVNEAFYSNIGTGKFDYGEDVNRDEIYPPENTNRNYNECTEAGFPSYYYQLNYIEANGYQLLNTKVKGNATLELTTKFLKSSANQYFGYGLEDGEYYAVTPDKKYAGTDIETGKIDKIVVNFGENHENLVNVNINNNDVLSYPILDVSQKELKLFGAGEYGTCRQLLYGAKIMQNGLMVRDFIPAMLKDTMQPGLYDLISKRFFTSLSGNELLRGGSPFEGINKNHINVFCNRGDDTFKIKETTITSYKVYKGTEMVRDYVPVIRNSDSKPGLFDVLTHSFLVSDADYELQFGKHVLHIFGEPKTIVEPTYCNEGEIIHKCSICGQEIHEKTERTSYKVTFLPDNSELTSIKIFETNDPNVYSNSLVGYTRNINTYNYSKFNASIRFEIPNAGSNEYEIITTSGEIEELYRGGYKITVITADTYVKIIEK